MAKQSKRGLLPRFFSFMLFVGVTLTLCAQHPGSLFIYTQNNKFAGRVVVGYEFWHSYTHSINKSLVMEKIAVKNGEFVIEEGWFKDYSTGIDSGTGKGFRQEQGYFVLSMERHVSELRIAVSPIPGHAIRAGERSFPLTLWAKRGETLVFRTKLY